MSTTVIAAPPPRADDDIGEEELDQETPVAPPDESDDGHYEIIDGVRVELPLMSVNASVLANRLTMAINLVAVPAELGEAYAEVMFRLPLAADRSRKPDVAFVPYSRWPRRRPLPRTAAWEVLPDLCVEVISPTDRAEAVRGKTDEYFRAGVRLVWVVYPNLELVDVYEAADRCRTLRRPDALDGGGVLPGFRVELAALFPEPEAGEAATG